MHADEQYHVKNTSIRQIKGKYKKSDSLLLAKAKTSTCKGHQR